MNAADLVDIEHAVSRHAADAHRDGNLMLAATLRTAWTYLHQATEYLLVRECTDRRTDVA